MNVTEVLAKVSKRPTRKRCGRGRGSGLGKTSGRGHKGAASRSGWRRRWGYDGGQTSLVRRLPKRGFSNHPFRKRYDLVNLETLESSFQPGETVSLEALAKRGIVSPFHGRLKVLGSGELTKQLTIVAAAVSESARRKIEAVGGRLEGLALPAKKRTKPSGPRSSKAAAKKTATEAES